MQHHEVAAAYARLILQAGKASPETLLKGTDLTEESLAQAEFLPWQSMARIFDNLDQLEESPAWTVRLGERLNITSHGALGFAALTAATLGEAVDVIGRYHAARLSTVEIELREEANQYSLVLHDLTGDQRFARRIAEIALKVIESLLLAVLGQPPGRQVVISLSRPAPDWQRELSAGYDAEVRYCGEHDAISIPASWRQLPSPLHEKSVHLQNILKCQQIIEARQAFSDTSHMVGFVLRSYFDACAAGRAVAAQPPTLEEIAARVHVAPRTLIRRLKQENSAYSEILEALRKEYAQRMLTDASLNVAEISARLGYTEPANFGRAFRRWFALSPAAWRRRK